MWTPKWHLSRNLKNLSSFEKEIKFCAFLICMMEGLYAAGIFRIFFSMFWRSSCCPSLKGSLHLLGLNVSPAAKA